MDAGDDERRDAADEGDPPPRPDPAAPAPEPRLVAEKLEGHDRGRMTSAGRRRTGGLVGRVRSLLGR